MWYLQNPNKEMYTWVTAEVFNKEECNRLKEMCTYFNIEAGGTGIREQKGESGNNEEMRLSDIAWIDFENIKKDTDPSTKQEIIKELDALGNIFINVMNDINNNFFQYNLTTLEMIQYTKYYGNVKGHYDWHNDHPMFNTPENNIRKLSISLLLSDPDEFTGGNFCIQTHKEPDTIELKQGQAIIFPSPIMHKVSPVESGVRESLVCWSRGPNWV